VMGEEAASLLFSELQMADRYLENPRKIVLEARLVCRASSIKHK
jgi:hypothetical protein